MSATASHLRVPAGTAARRLAASPEAVFLSITFYAVVVAVVTALWRAAAGAAGGSVGGYSARELTWYIVTSEAAVLAVSSALVDETGRAIAGGDLEVELLRPRAPVVVRMATEVGAALTRLCWLLPAGAAVALVTVGAPPGTAGLLLAAPSLVLAVVVEVASRHVVAAAAFWWRDATTAWFLQQKAVFVVGGMLVPLELLPGGLRPLAWALPFQASAYSPARLASGHAEPLVLAVQAGWAVAATLLALWAFRRGERRMARAGG